MIVVRSSMHGNIVIEHVDGKHHVFVFWYARGRDSCYTVLSQCVDRCVALAYIS